MLIAENLARDTLQDLCVAELIHNLQTSSHKVASVKTLLKLSIQQLIW